MGFHLHRHQKADGRSLWLYSQAPRDYTMTEELPSAGAAANPERRWHAMRAEPVYVNASRNTRTLNPPSDYNPLAAGRPGGYPTEVNVTDFEVAIFENRWPSLVDNGLPGQDAYGRCEVVVYSKTEAGSLGDLDPGQAALLLQAIGDRTARIMEDPGITAVVPFENRGAFIGATLPHPHGQIYAFADMPPTLARQVAALNDLDAPLMDAACTDEALVVENSGTCRTFCPTFARYPYETWIMPNRGVAAIGDLDDDELLDFAGALTRQVRRFDRLFGAATPYVMWHAVPPRGATRWPYHIQFWPLQRGDAKMKYLASVEQITGMFLVDVPPEEAANGLRAVDITEAAA